MHRYILGSSGSSLLLSVLSHISPIWNVGQSIVAMDTGFLPPAFCSAFNGGVWEKDSCIVSRKRLRMFFFLVVVCLFLFLFDFFFLFCVILDREERMGKLIGCF